MAFEKSLYDFWANWNAKRSDDGVQPVALVVELDHGLVDRDVIRRSPGFGLQLRLVNSVEDRRSGTGNAEYFENRYSIRKRKFCEIQLNIKLHQLAVLLLAHKTYIDLVQTAVEVGGFPHEKLKSHRAPLLPIDTLGRGSQFEVADFVDVAIGLAYQMEIAVGNALEFFGSSLLLVLSFGLFVVTISNYN